MNRTLKESDKKQVAFNQKWCCAKCKEMLPSTYQIDHIIPHSISFDDNLTNLEALCPNCHSKKTQKENFRISSFKKLCSIKEESLCWFCLERLDYDHSCDKVFKKIEFKKPEKKQNKNNKELDKFIYVEEKIEEPDRTLNIKLRDDVIWINKYFTIMDENTTIEDIAKAINMATRSKKEMRFYDNIIIDINMNPYQDPDLEEAPEELINCLEKELPLLINKNIFVENTEIEYTFLLL